MTGVLPAVGDGGSFASCYPVPPLDCACACQPSTGSFSPSPPAGLGGGGRRVGVRATRREGMHFGRISQRGSGWCWPLASIVGVMVALALAQRAAGDVFSSSVALGRPRWPFHPSPTFSGLLSAPSTFLMAGTGHPPPPSPPTSKIIKALHPVFSTFRFHQPTAAPLVSSPFISPLFQLSEEWRGGGLRSGWAGLV